MYTTNILCVFLLLYTILFRISPFFIVFPVLGSVASTASLLFALKDINQEVLCKYHSMYLSQVVIVPRSIVTIPTQFLRLPLSIIYLLNFFIDEVLKETMETKELLENLRNRLLVQLQRKFDKTGQCRATPEQLKPVRESTLLSGVYFDLFPLFFF